MTAAKRRFCSHILKLQKLWWAVPASSSCRAGRQCRLPIAAALLMLPVDHGQHQTVFSAHKFKAEKLCWYSDVRGSLPQSVLRTASSPIRWSQNGRTPLPSSDDTHRNPGLAGIRQRRARIRRIRVGWSRAASSTRLLKGRWQNHRF